MSRCCRLASARLFFVCCLLAAGMLLPSCGREAGQKEVYRTTGEMFLGSAPAEGARLAFHPQQRDSADEWPSGYPRAVVDAAGKFVVETYGVGDGCPPGEYVVLVTWPATIPGEGGEEAETVDRLAGRYAVREASPLKAKVEAKATSLGRYDLK